ncbi:ferredoxin [Nisaea sp.]|uniref:ferredoxin n=1 Tax=Nisaea sp. TaxID=2024842 RepID=UPI0032669E6D
MTDCGTIAVALERYGLLLRSGFHPEVDEIKLSGGESAGTVLLVGNAGPGMWREFSANRPAGANPLDRWSREVLDEVAGSFGAEAVLPSDGPPFRPFQQWAMRAEPVFPSPIGILIHPVYGLWHGYRGALLFERMLDLPDKDLSANPCDSCTARPCLSTCPVGAFSERGYDVQACRRHLRSGAGDYCLDGSCLARQACPVGRDYAYGAGQAVFHMAAFV